MKRRSSESGFAMLLIFAMASIVAISLYFALPRVAFESQRDKEQTLIDRGEQYKRSIQLFVRKNKRWPAKVEDLENTNGIRYLRRRYVDPMTGKDEWRLIHVNNGILTDSLIKKKDAKDAKSVDNFITELSPIGGVTDTQGGVNPGLRKRASDQTPQSSTDGSSPPTPGVIGPNGQPIGPPSSLPPGMVTPGQNGSSPQQLQPFGNPASQQAGSQMGGITVLGGVGSVAPTPTNTTQAAQMAGQFQAQNPGLGQVPGQSQGQMPGNAAQMIQNLLTSPRPGGAPTGAGAAASGTVQGGGIAGFASKFDGEGIKLYNEQDEYKKWEFVYDMSKDSLVNPQNGAAGTTAGQSAQPGMGTNTGANQSSFGQSSFGQAGQSNTGVGTTSQTPVNHP